jgi:transposase, IS5 family
LNGRIGGLAKRQRIAGVGDNLSADCDHDARRQALSNLSDDQAEYQLRDRLSFIRFLGLGLEDAVPDAKTLWLYREALAKAGAVEELFNLFDGFMKDKGYLAMGGKIIDATIVSAPKQHNSREDNETIKKGETPEDWKSKPAKNRQKDKDSRWTKKHERSYFGYKNHRSSRIRRAAALRATDAPPATVRVGLR